MRVACWIKQGYTRARMCSRPRSCTHTHTHTEVCDTYCSYTTTVVSRMHLNVTLYVHSLSCSALISVSWLCADFWSLSFSYLFFSVLYFLPCTLSTVSSIFFFFLFLNYCFSLSPFLKFYPSITYSALNITLLLSFTLPFILPPSQFIIPKNSMFPFLSHLYKPELYLAVKKTSPT